MSSNYSRSPEDDFFYALNKSLTNEYSSQKMSNFINDLLAAINNLDDDPDEVFGFYDEESDCWSSFDYFTWNDYREPCQRRLRKNRVTLKSPAHDISVDMFAEEQSQKLLSHIKVSSQREANDVSVDMFDDEPDEKTETEVHDMSVDLIDDDGRPQSLPRPNAASISEKETDDVSVDMFSEFESDVEAMDADSDCSDAINIHEHSEVVDCKHEEAVDADRITQMNGQRKDESSKNESKTIFEDVQVGKVPDAEFHKGINLHKGHFLGSDEPVSTRQKLLQQNIESSEAACTENEKTLTVQLQPSQLQSRMTQQSSGNIIEVPEILFTIENLSQDGERKILRTDDERANTSIQSSCQTSLFRGFSPVAPLVQQPICSSTKLDSDLNTTLCEEYEFANNFVPNLRRSPSQSPTFLGFSAAVLPVSRTSEGQNSMSNSSRREASLNTTVCEEYETARLFAIYLNATESITLDDAYTQCFSESQNQGGASASNRRQSFINEIEKLVLKIQNDLVSGRTLSIAVPYRVSWDNCVVNEERLFLRPLSNGRTRNINSKRRIALVVYILSFVYKLLINNETCTRRQIYYSDPEFTHSKIQVDETIMDVCFLLNARPWEIGILSSSKGLIAGSIKLTLKDDTILDVGSVDGGILLPHQTMSIKKVETDAKFVLLVEKHTVYEKLLLENVLNRLGPCILITGKGFPDINTRAILKKIWDDCKCPIYALVDADPFGIEIMLSYRHGSQKMSFFNESLAIPSIQWIGVFPSEIKKFNLQSLPLTQGDVSRVHSLMNRPYLRKGIYKELLVMEKTLKKTEVEALISSGIVDWIDSYLLHKIQSGGSI